MPRINSPAELEKFRKDISAKGDTKSIDDYLAIGGYYTLVRALSQMTPVQLLERVKDTNLRGKRGE